MLLAQFLLEISGITIWQARNEELENIGRIKGFQVARLSMPNRPPLLTESTLSNRHPKGWEIDKIRVVGEKFHNLQKNFNNLTQKAW